MKKIISTTAAILVSVVLMAQTSANLKLNLEKNKAYRVKSKSEQNTTITVGGNVQLVETKTQTSISLKPISAGDGFMMAEVRFDTTITKISMPKMEINSTKTGSINSSNNEDVMNCIMNRFSKAVFNVKLSLSGNVIEISNLKAISEELNKSIDSIQGQMATIKTQLVQMLGESTIKGSIEAITAYLPGKQVNVGDKWDSNIKMSGGGLSMSINSNYKLKKITGNQAEIAADVTIEPASQEPTVINGMPMTYDIRGLGKSNITVDTKTGWMSKASSKSHLQGNMNIKAQGNDMQIPLEVDSSTEVIALP